MAQIIKNRRGSLDKLASATGSLQKGEILIATGSSKLTGVTNGQGLVFAAVESGSVVAANRVLQGAIAPIFSGSTYGHMLDGVPFYASSSNTLFLLGADGNTTPDLTGNISTFSSSVSSSFASLSQSVASVTGDFSSSVATSFSASAYDINALSASTYKAVFEFGGLSASVATSFSASNHYINDLSASIATTDSASKATQTELSASIYQTDTTQSAAITANSASFATSISASNYNITSLSASVASVTGDFSSSVATSFSASAATITNLSSSVATNVSASTFARTALSGAVATTISDLSSSIATTDSASAARIAALSASVASVTGDFSSSVATSFSSSAASQTTLSASIATTDNAQSNRLTVIENTFATTGSNTFSGSQVVSGSLWVTGDVTIYGSSSLLNVTASQITLGTNTILLNTANPGVRFGGISVIDSGSSQATGSLFWDSQKNGWIYQKQSGSSYNSAMLINGPRNSGSLGDEQGLTAGYIPVAQGGDHIMDSIISASATKVTVEGGLDVTGNISASTITGIGNVTDYSSSVASRVETIETSLGNGGSLGTRVSGLEALTGSYATTGSNTFDGDQNLGVNKLTLDGGNFENSFGGVQVYSNDFAQLNYDNYSYVWVDNSGVNLEIDGTTMVFNGDLQLPAYTLPNAYGNANQVLSNDGSGNLSWTDLVDSASVFTQFSASTFDIAQLSSSVSSVSGDFSSSVASDFNTLSTSVDSRLVTVEFSASTFATTGSNVFHGDQTLTGSFAMTGTANFNNAVAVNDSNMNLGNNSALNLTGGSSIYVADSGVISGSIVGIGNVTQFSSSVDSRLSSSLFTINDLSASIGAGGTGIGQRVANLEALTGSYATTGSNTFDGNQNLGGNSLSLDGGYVQNDNGGIELYSTAFAQLNYDASSYVWVDNNGVHLETIGGTAQFDNDGNLILPAFTLPNTTGGADQVLSNDGSGNLSWIDLVNSASVATQFSASNASQSTLSASVASVTGDFSSSVATSFSASAASQNTLSASIATTDSASAASIIALSASIATTDSASAAHLSQISTSVNSRLTSSVYELQQVSASLAGDLTILSQSVSTSFSASSAARTALSSSFVTNLNTVSNSVNSRITAIETTFATTGSNTFLGQQKITGDVIVTGSVYIASGYDLDVNHIVGNNGYIELGNTDTDLHIQAQADLYLVGSGSGVHVHDSVFSVAPIAGTNALIVSASRTSVLNEFSASNISGVGNIGVFSQSVNSRLVGLENFEASSSTALQFTGSNLTVLGDLTVKGTTTSVNSTTVDLGTNIINLNGTEAAFGGIQVADPTSPNTTSGSLLWDTTTDRWIAGPVGSEVNVLLATGDNIFSSSIQTALSGTFGYATFDSAISTSFSASAYNVSKLSASVASVTGDFSASVATSFSASTFVVNELSYSVDSRLDTIESSLGSGGSLGTRVSGLEALTGSYATTGSNQFDGNQIITGSVTISDFVQSTTLQGTGSLYLKPDANSGNYLEVYNTFPSDVHIKSSTEVTYVGNDTTYVQVVTDGDTITLSAPNGVYATGIDSTIGAFSQSVDSRLHTLETTIDGGSF